MFSPWASKYSSDGWGGSSQLEWKVQSGTRHLEQKKAKDLSVSNQKRANERSVPGKLFTIGNHPDWHVEHWLLQTGRSMTHRTCPFRNFAEWSVCFFSEIGKPWFHCNPEWSLCCAARTAAFDSTHPSPLEAGLLNHPTGHRSSPCCGSAGHIVKSYNFINYTLPVNQKVDVKSCRCE